jgi:hypothetical protein
MYNPIKKLNQVKLSTLNFYAYLLHLASAVGIGFFFLYFPKPVEYNTDLYTYKITNIDEDNPRNITFAFGDGEAPKIDVSGLSLKLLIVFIFLITAAFHFFYFTNYRYYKEILKGRNRFRWVEYGITATIMIFILCVISGVKEIYATLGIVCLTIVMMSFGYFFEMNKDPKVKLSAIIMGFFILVAVWSIILGNFVPNIISAKNDQSYDIPDWVYGVLFPMIFWWASFGIVTILNYRAYRKKNYDFCRYERYYILLSYFSKAFMGYYLAFGLSRDKPEKKT